MNDGYDPKAKPSTSSVVASSSIPAINTVVDARPPWHSVAFVLTVMTLCIHQCYSTINSLDGYGNHHHQQQQQYKVGVASLETFTRRVFPQFVSLKMMGWIRLSIAFSIWLVLASTLTSEGWIQTTTYRPGSKLQNNVKIVMIGRKTLFPFTSWCWILLGISFTLNAILALAVAYMDKEWTLYCLEMYYPWWTLRFVVLLWQTTAPCAFLVSTVIRYVIWDKVLKGKNTSTVHLKHFRNIMAHNMNSVFVLIEVALLGGLPIRISEMYLGPFFGSCYIWMAWSLVHYWTSKEFGPHFLYFFLDTTLGIASTIALFCLTATLCLFYVVLSFAKMGLDQIPQMLVGEEEDYVLPQVRTNTRLLTLHLTFVLGIASLVVRFRD